MTSLYRLPMKTMLEVHRLAFGLIAVSASLLSAAEPASGLSDANIDQLRQTAAARCRAAFETESGQLFAHSQGFPFSMVLMAP